MKIRKSSLLSLVSLVIMLIVCAMAINCHYAIMKDSQETSELLSASTGNLVKVLRGYTSKEVPDASLVVALKESIAQQSMMISMLEFNVSKFDSTAFEGICEIVASKDTLFPVSGQPNVMSIRNDFINARLSKMRQYVFDEFTARSNRKGNGQRCRMASRLG